MKRLRSALWVFVLVATAGGATAQPSYPAPFIDQWQGACLTSCKANPAYQGREAHCPSYCACVVQAAQASFPMDVVLQANRDLQAGNSGSPSVLKLDHVLKSCQGRVMTAGLGALAPADRTGQVTGIQLRRGGGGLPTHAVYARAAPAVYIVRSNNGRLGSAVAVSATALLTNCHIVAGGSEITLERAGVRRAASLVSADEVADRCVLRSATAMPAWASVRPYADLRLGERVYAIGSPAGMELSISDGVVTAKPVIADQRVIQTSAPLMVGSSGGGLFDAAANLIGITTFQLRGTQNVNFAIPAEDYAK